MKDAKFTIEFLSPCLANGGNPDTGVPDKFQRDGLNRIVMQQCWFHSAITRAIPMTRVKDIKAVEVQIDLVVSAPTVPHERRFGDGNTRIHESIAPGTKVTFNAMLADHITKDDLRNILDKMGKYVGLSPYGHKVGFGKFNVVDVSVQEQ